MKTIENLYIGYSSIELEYMALSDAAQKALIYKQLFCELHIPSYQQPVTILSDSQSALNITENPAKYRQAKHIDVWYHAIRHYIHNHNINVDCHSFRTSTCQSLYQSA